MSDADVAERLYDSDAPIGHQRRAFRAGDVPVAVYGLGKLGLPVAAVLADVCGNVTGADVDPDVVDAIEAGECPVENEPGLDDLVAETVEDGAFTAVDDPAQAAQAASIHVVVVPTLLTDDGEPDLATLIAAASSIAAGLSPGDLVLLESTVPPETTAEVFEPGLADASGLDRDEFGVAFCPERTRSGRMLRDIREAYPKIVGGTDPEATRSAALVYDQVTRNDVIEMGSATAAEAVKVFGGIYRDVNIGLANELARYADAMGVDAREVIEASNTQPLSSIHDPGPGVGGHCIPVYPHFLTEEFDVDGPVIRAARALNDDMPAYTVDRLADELAARGTDVADATVLLLGVAYRGDVAETRNSPALDVAALLSDYGTEVLAVDPVVEDVPGLAAEEVSLRAAARRSPDAAVLVTHHEAFDDANWNAFDEMVFLDGRDALDLSATPHRHCTVGDGDAPDDRSRWRAMDPRRPGGEGRA